MVILKDSYDPRLGHRCVEVETDIGDVLIEVLTEAEALARRLGCRVQFVWNNGRLAWIAPGMDVQEQYRWLVHSWEMTPAARDSVGA